MKKSKKAIRFIYDGDEELMSLQDLKAFRQSAKEEDVFSEIDRSKINALIDTLEKAGGDEYDGELITLELVGEKEEKLKDIEEAWTLGIEAAVTMVCDINDSTIEKLSQSVLGEVIEAVEDLTLSQAKSITNKCGNGISIE